MNGAINRIKNKLNNTGETIGETLVALLISALALVMLAGAISSAAKMITASDKQMGKYYESDAKLATQNGTADGTLTAVTLTGEVKDREKAFETHLSVDYFLNDAFSSKPVIAY